MIEVGVHEIRANLADVINRVAYGGERVVLERRNKPVLALVSLEDLRLLEQLEERADVKAALKARKEGGKPIPLAQIEADLGIAKNPRASRNRRIG
ncbi:MAG: type II toxin-antitoxin system Phd/YefM family antitoxin [Thermoguttaceae bacterium]